MICKKEMNPWERTEKEIEEHERVVDKIIDHLELTEQDERVLFDKPCLMLCDALNRIPDVCTISSCCGHGRDAYDILFLARSNVALFDVGRWFGWPSRSHVTTMEWAITLDKDTIWAGPNGVAGHLYSLIGPVGERAYKEAFKTAQRINSFYDGKIKKPLFLPEELFSEDDQATKTHLERRKK